MGYEIEAREHEENCRNVKHLVGILKMMQSPESLLQDLLDAIVEIFDDADEEEVESGLPYFMSLNLQASSCTPPLS